MRQLPRWVHWVMVLNLLLWLAVCGSLTGIRFTDPGSIAPVAWIGVGLAAVLQHWAYYRTRRSDSKARPSTSD
jgi:hypothetical protein